tara:strand:+ start:696 stop:1274 length:579 start_codon:yes stop_codon:yes gene_type:complete
MEIKKISDFIKIYDGVLGERKNNIFYEILKSNFFKYNVGKVVDNKVSTIKLKERSVKTCELTNKNTNSITEIHWANLLQVCFTQGALKFIEDTKASVPCIVDDIQILKYSEGDFYKKHTDDGPGIKRTLSFIYLVNDDYEEGALEFEIPGSGKISIEVKKDRMIVWPSCFLYPHKVLPIKKGVKYSVVAWAS